MNVKQIQWFLGGVSKPFAPLGILYNKTSFPTLADFTNVGATASIVSNQIQVSGGTGTFTQRLDLTAYGYTCLEKWKITAQVKVSTTNTTSYGFGFGVTSVSSTLAGSQYHVDGRFVMTTGLGGTDGIVVINAGTSYGQRAFTVPRVTFSVNDVIQLVVERNKHTITVTANNVTTAGASVSTSYTYSTSSASDPIIQNTGVFSLYNHGGTYLVQSIKVESGEYTGARVVLVGDSKVTGYVASALANCFNELLLGTYGSNQVVASAGPSDGLAEHLLRINEIKLLNPQKYLICGASNDIRAASGSTNTNYASLVSQLSAVSPVYHTTGLKESVLDQTALRTYIQANYASGNIIDTLPTTLTLGDGVHPNDAGHSTFAGLITASGKI